VLSDLVRRWQRSDGQDVEITSRLLSSVDGSFAPLNVTTDFYQVLDARNKLIAMQYSLGHTPRTLRRDTKASMKRFVRPARHGRGGAAKNRRTCLETGRAPRKHRNWSTSENSRASSSASAGRRPGSRDLLDDSRLEFRVKNFRAICGARIVPEAQHSFTFEFDENTSDLEVGDSVLIHAGRISSTATITDM